MRVRVTGVVSRPDLNGREGIVSACPAAAPLRAIVTLDPPAGEGALADKGSQREGMRVHCKFTECSMDFQWILTEGMHIH